MVHGVLVSIQQEPYWQMRLKAITSKWHILKLSLLGDAAHPFSDEAHG